MQAQDTKKTGKENIINVSTSQEDTYKKINIMYSLKSVKKDNLLSL